jgi:hypothetical protein
MRWLARDLHESGWRTAGMALPNQMPIQSSPDTTSLE